MARSNSGKIWQQERKPFIDKNLQIQIPSQDKNAPSIKQNTKAIYAHYCASNGQSQNQLSSTQKELQTAMNEAKQSYSAWNKLKSRLKQLISQ